MTQIYEQERNELQIEYNKTEIQRTKKDIE
jgi:hypothetical protein